MVIDVRTHSIRRHGFVSMDLFLAMALFLFGFFGIAFVSTREMRLARAYYYDAIAMSLVDGELEVLAAGEWQSLPEGESTYHSKAPTMSALPPGEFRATRSTKRIQLEWIPAQKGNGRHIVRGFALKQIDAPHPEAKR